MTLTDAVIVSIFGERSSHVWDSKDFQAAAFNTGPGVTRLAVQRGDQASGISWDDLQRIKRECGYGDKDAIEFYPREADVVNLANLRHLYIFDEKLPLVLRPSERNMRQRNGNGT